MNCFDMLKCYFCITQSINLLLKLFYLSILSFRQPRSEVVGKKHIKCFIYNYEVLWISAFYFSKLNETFWGEALHTEKSLTRFASCITETAYVALVGRFQQPQKYLSSDKLAGYPISQKPSNFMPLFLLYLLLYDFYQHVISH